MPADWTRYTHARLGLGFAYPRSVFRLTETPRGVTLVSSLARDELGGDPHPAKWVFSLRVVAREASAEDAFKRDEPVWFDATFPHGVFTAQEGVVARVHFAGLDGYELASGIEGYDRDVLFLARGPASSLVVRFDTVGDVMGPSPPQAEQERIFGIVRGSITVSPGPRP